MSSTYQIVGLLAIVVGLAGTWLAAKRRSGWLLNVVSTVMWLPALVTGAQWAAVLNCALSIAICVRNYYAQRGPAAKVDPPSVPTGAAAERYAYAGADLG